MAASNTKVTLATFGGESENWRDFECQLRKLIQVANVAEANRVGYLKLQKKSSQCNIFTKKMQQLVVTYIDV